MDTNTMPNPVRFTDGDVAAILATVIYANRSGRPAGAYDVAMAAGMPFSIYNAAVRYAMAHRLLRTSGQLSVVTFRGRRYMRSATLPPTHRRESEWPPEWPATTDNFDRPSVAY